MPAGFEGKNAHYRLQDQAALVAAARAGWTDATVMGLPPFWSSGFASAAAYWRVEQSPPIIFMYQVERLARVSCCPRPTDRPAFLAAVPESCSAANLVEYPPASAAIGMAYIYKKKNVYYNGQIQLIISFNFWFCVYSGREGHSPGVLQDLSTVVLPR